MTKPNDFDRPCFEHGAKLTIELPLHNVRGPICAEDLKREVQRVLGHYGIELQQQANLIVATCASGELVVKDRTGPAGFTPSVLLPATSLPGNEREAHVEPDYHSDIVKLDGQRIALDLRAPGSPMEHFAPGAVVSSPPIVAVWCNNQIIGLLRNVKTHSLGDALSLHGDFELSKE